MIVVNVLLVIFAYWLIGWFGWWVYRSIRDAIVGLPPEEKWKS
jgi:hypothetical protein